MLCQVGPRDGLQNEGKPIPTETKVELIERLAAAGLPVVEATSFVSPKWVPQLADAAEVMARIRPQQGVRYPVLAPNMKVRSWGGGEKGGLGSAAGLHGLGTVCLAWPAAQSWPGGHGSPAPVPRHRRHDAIRCRAGPGQRAQGGGQGGGHLHRRLRGLQPCQHKREHRRRSAPAVGRCSSGEKGRRGRAWLCVLRRRLPLPGAVLEGWERVEEGSEEDVPAAQVSLRQMLHVGWNPPLQAHAAGATHGPRSPGTLSRAGWSPRRRHEWRRLWMRWVVTRCPWATPSASARPAPWPPCLRCEHPGLGSIGWRSTDLGWLALVCVYFFGCEPASTCRRSSCSNPAPLLLNTIPPSSFSTQSPFFHPRP